MDDLLNLEACFTEEERLIRDNVTRFVKAEVTPLMPDAFEKGVWPESLIQSCAQLGLFGLTLPVEYGGAGASYVAYGLVCQALEQGDSALRSFVSVQSSLCMYPIYRYGHDDQKKHWLPKMARGEVIGCFGLTEPDAGSDPASMLTVAQKVAGGYRLNGTKLWITNSPIADIGIIWARMAEGFGGFIVDMHSEGVKATAIHAKMSLRASITGEIALNDVFVPDDHVLPLTQNRLSAALACLNQARYGIAWGAIGAAMACFDITRDYLMSRKQFNKPLASFQLVQRDLAHMYTEIIKAQWMNWRIGCLKDSGQETAPMISLAKSNACRQALTIARMCRNLLGANGISLEYHVIRHMLNLESVFTYEGTDNIHTLILGRHITDISAFE